MTLHSFIHLLDSGFHHQDDKVVEICGGEFGGAASSFLYHSSAGDSVRPAHGCRDQCHQSQGRFIWGQRAKVYDCNTDLFIRENCINKVVAYIM